MSFAQNTAPATYTIPADKKATAFVNIYMTNKAGKEEKVGAISLKEATKFQTAVIARLQNGGQEALDGFKGKIRMDFRMATPEAQEPVDPDSLGW